MRGTPVFSASLHVNLNNVLIAFNSWRTTTLLGVVANELSNTGQCRHNHNPMRTTSYPQLRGVFCLTAGEEPASSARVCRGLLFRVGFFHTRRQMIPAEMGLNVCLGHPPEETTALLIPQQFH